MWVKIVPRGRRLLGSCRESLDTAPQVEINDQDDAALYFTSGTTGTPKAILHTHGNLVSACITENRHHLQTHEDNFLHSALYHTGAKMHWFGSLIVGSSSFTAGVEPRWILEAVSEKGVYCLAAGTMGSGYSRCD